MKALGLYHCVDLAAIFVLYHGVTQNIHISLSICMQYYSCIKALFDAAK